MTPLVAGELELPAIEFCYFDPEAETYKTLEAHPGVLRVFSSGERGARAGFDEQLMLDEGTVDVIGEDILPIVTDADELRPYRPSPTTMPALFALPVLGYSGLAAAMIRKRRFEHDTGLARAHGARSACRKRLHGVARAAEPEDELYRALMGLIADKFDLSEAGLTSNEVERLFERNGMDREVAGNFLKILRACERARYASAQLSPEEVNALTHGALASLEGLEAALKKGGTK